DLLHGQQDIIAAQGGEGFQVRAHMSRIGVAEVGDSCPRGTGPRGSMRHWLQTLRPIDHGVALLIEDSGLQSGAWKQSTSSKQRSAIFNLRSEGFPPPRPPLPTGFSASAEFLGTSRSGTGRTS